MYIYALNFSFDNATVENRLLNVKWWKNSCNSASVRLYQSLYIFCYYSSAIKGTLWLLNWRIFIWLTTI